MPVRNEVDMTPDEIKDKLFQRMVKSKFSVAEFIYVMETIDDKLIMDMNLTAKQIALLPMLKTLLMATSVDMNESKFESFIGALLATAQDRDINPLDVLYAVVFTSVSIMQVFGLMMSDEFVELKADKPEAFTEEHLVDWLNKNIKTISSEELKEQIIETMDCDGECENCPKCEDNNPSDQSTKLH